MLKNKDLKGKLIGIDLDETISTGKFWKGEPKPIQKMIDKIWEWYKSGAHIIIFTARSPRYYALTLAWLIKHNVPFHGIMMGKVSADYYIDSKNGTKL